MMETYKRLLTNILSDFDVQGYMIRHPNEDWEALLIDPLEGSRVVTENLHIGNNTYSESLHFFRPFCSLRCIFQLDSPFKQGIPNLIGFLEITIFPGFFPLPDEPHNL